MLQSVGRAVSCALVPLAEATYEVFSLTGHRLGIVELPKVLHKFLHLHFVDTFIPDGMSAREQVVHHDSGRPHISFLSISEDVGHLLGRLVKECSTFCEVSDCVQRVLHC